ncbi:MAG: substrate-binding domain-containing protein [Muribaculaceae bacterium]|nr:substrate-binding domain-containing protein [Muribaculaceae bacterium]
MMYHNGKLTIALVGVLTVILAMLTSGCREEKRYRIGVSQCSQDDWRAKMNEEIEREIMFHEDAEVEIRSADDDNDRQAADLRYFADNGFDAIIVSPNEARPLTPVIKEIYDSGIPVIIFDRNIIGESYTARIGTDDRGLGAAAARYALTLLPASPQVVEIYGLRGSTPADARHEGFMQAFTAGGGRVAGIIDGHWNKDDATLELDSLLRRTPDIDLIYAHNDRMAIGASEVARRLGRKDIKIIGIDAAPEIGIKAVADSVIDATFLYPTDGHLLIRTALAILRGEPYQRESIVPASSAVDRSNADILLIQNRALQEETDKMKILKSRIDTYWERHSSQTILFYASIAIILLLVGVVFLVLRTYWQHRRHQQILMAQYRTIEEERDKQKVLNERLSEATQSKLIFFTNVSHDLRTPLTLVAEPVAQLVNAPNLTAAQHSMMRIADKNVRILMRLINQILDFRKYENSRLSLHLTEVDISSLLTDWVESFRPLAARHDIKLSLNGPDAAEAPVSLAVDVEKMERVVFNLLSNAFKFTPDNGRIRVEWQIADRHLIIKVADTGRGISRQDLDNIFERFYQVDRVNPQGSGIGLALAKAFVELHEGNISAESEPGRGTEFTVSIPLRHVAETPQSVESGISKADIEAELDDVECDTVADDGRPLILLIDDNADIRSLVGGLLNDEYNIITAADGSEGIRRAVKHVPDLIICDVMMPVMDGLQCCRTLKEEVTTSHIPVLMLTACTMDEQRVEGYESGADGYLSKPFSAAVLRSRCESLIANRRRIRRLWPEADAAAPATPAPAAPASSAATSVATEADTKTDTKATPLSATSRPGSQMGAGLDSEFYRRFLEIFTAEMGNPEMNVDALAGRMGLERSQFYRKIKALTNYSPVELMRKLRLQQARQLLVGTEKSISEIAYEVGFSTPAYFTKCYREAFGETPTAVRSKLNL